MAFLGDSEAELVLALEEGATAVEGWGAFLARLAALTGARFAAMVSRMPGFVTPVDIAVVKPSGTMVRVDTEAIEFALGDGLRPERIYTSPELADLFDAGEDLSMQAVLARLDAISVNAVRVSIPDTVSMVVGIFGARNFDAADGAVLRRLFPYLKVAARTASRLWRERLCATITAGLAQRNSLGWFLLDGAGVVLDAWQAMPPLRDIRILPSAQGNRLAFADRAAGMKLATILEHIAAGNARRTHALRVSHDPAMHLHIARAPREWAFDPRRPVALATLHRAGHPGPDSVGILIDLFGLLPSEARLATALAGGDTLNDAAGRLGLTIETARNYSKKIFAKTGTRGQSDLVRLIWASGLAEPVSD